MLRPISKIMIHHSGSDNDTFESMKQYHLSIGDLDIAYDYIVEGKEIKIGRPLTMQGAHCYGHNQDSASICICGDFSHKAPTPQQYTRVVDAIVQIQDIYGRKDFEICGHNKYYATECPGIIDISLIQNLVNKKNNPRKHWCENDWKYCNENGFTINEKRFDDTCTRAEIISLFARFLRMQKGE